MNEQPDLAQLTADGLLPIREVARVTGVNAVTLRAWERRYGLIVPLRTPKGHRLYEQAHIQRVRDILTWLNRGVAVSQIKPLLDTSTPPELPQQNQWSELLEELLQAIDRLSERRLDDTFNRAMALYPPRTLCQHLVQPLLDALEQRWQGQYGAALERVLFHSWLRSKLATRIYFNNRQQAGRPLLLANLDDESFAPGLWLTAWLVSSTDCPVEIIEWPVPLNELDLAAQRIRPRAILLYASNSLLGTCLQRDLPRLVEQSVAPLVMAGPAVHIHAPELQRHHRLMLAGDPLAALQQLHDAGLLPGSEGRGA
ncbi:MerR family transcriptional regulator [Pseudomonas stutzeri]|uniref:Helix-turn-helix-type transcriptional regulator n=1 Tax=Stutzerimonas stutzeri TaxID=316 RepID=A0A2N8RZQ5_STUST|nr:MerR family transcriptional regulator [Stutzerimonas stutzeri]MCQ4295199.1 MerR family transcriptional regulator [Stutzerimonas stutzeri]PNF79865.1 helix-turn-helix-type transcriptional regulator [Stutzerimonas stutzeri]